MRAVLFCLISLLFSIVYGASEPCSAFAIMLDSSQNVTVYGSSGGSQSANQTAWGVCSAGSSGQWYSIKPANGHIVQLSTCSDYTACETTIGVYTGTCDNLSCYAHSTKNYDCDNSRGSIVTWKSTGVEYYISVSSDTTNTCNFALSVQIPTDYYPETCSGAIYVPGPYNETTFNGAGYLNQGTKSFCSFSSDAKPYWLRITPTPGNPMTISTCSSQTIVPMVLVVYVGSCDHLQCEAMNSDTPCPLYNVVSTGVVEFVPVEQSYYVVILANSPTSGGFQVSFTQEDPNACEAALPGQVSSRYSYFTEGDLQSGEFLQQQICGSDTGLAVWYRLEFVDTGSVRCNTCYDPSFDTVLSVYDGTCPKLSCLTSNDDYCSSQSLVLFDITQANQIVYVVVSGYEGATGTYSLSCSYQ